MTLPEKGESPTKKSTFLYFFVTTKIKNRRFFISATGIRFYVIVLTQ